MSSRNLIIVIVLAIVLVGAIVGEGYFYFYSQKQNNAAEAVIQSIQNSLDAKQSVSALAQAESNLQAQTEKLQEMQADFPSSPVLDATIGKDLSSAAAAAAKADSLAADPKLDITTQANIIALGQEAAQALAYLQSLEKNHASTVAQNDAAENAVELVSAYVNELFKYIDGLTPANSGLTPSEIAAYKSEADALIAEINSTEDSLNQLDDIPASSVPDITPTSTPPLAIFNSNNNNNNSAGSNSSDNSSDSSNGTSSNSNQNSDQGDNSGGSITLGDIVNQENVVSEDTNQVNQLSDEDNGNASSSDSSNNSSSSDDNNNNNNDGSNSGGDNGGSGIQSQGGPVKLIQGENTF